MTRSSLAYLNQERYSSHDSQGGMELTRKREFLLGKSMFYGNSNPHLLLRKNPPKSMTGMMSGGASARATWRLGAMQETK